MTTQTPAAPTSAKVLSEILAPWVIVVLLPIAVAWQATHALAPTALWGLWVALTSSILPMGIIVWGARTQRWDGHHVRNREGRLIPFLALIGFSGLGLAVLFLANAPWPVIALDLSMLATLLVSGVITVRWKISMHVAVAAGAVVIVAATYPSPLVWLLALAVLAVAWSRVQLRDHTTAQVLAGAAAGILVGGGAFIALV